MVPRTMQILKLMLVFFLTVLIVDALPSKSLSHGRSKRGFRQSIIDRMGHGFGKRADSSLYDTYLDNEPQHGFMTVEEFAGNIMQRSDLAEAVVEKFIDSNKDGIISAEELLSKPSE